MIQNVIHAFFRPIRFINFLYRFKMGIPAILLLLAFFCSTNQLIAGSSFTAPAAIVADTFWNSFKENYEARQEARKKPTDT